MKKRMLILMLITLTFLTPAGWAAECLECRNGSYNCLNIVEQCRIANALELIAEKMEGGK